MKNGLLLIDGNGLAWRVTTGKLNTGFPSVVLYQATRELLDLQSRFPSWFTILVFDGGRSVYREAIFPGYKAHRVNTEDRLRVRDGVRLAQEALDYIGRPYIRVEGVEADDIISILAFEARTRNIPAVIVSDDSDLYQCLGGSVTQYVPRKKQHLTAAEALAEWGGSTTRYLLWKALAGDPTDNIPGVEGIGPKRAHELVALSKGVVAWLWSDGAKAVLDGKKWAAKIWTESGREQLRTAYALVRTAREYGILDKSGTLGKLTEAEVRRVLARHRDPMPIPRDQWGEFLRRWDVFPLLSDTIQLERLYGFRVTSPT